MTSSRDHHVITSHEAKFESEVVMLKSLWVSLGWVEGPLERFEPGAFPNIYTDGKMKSVPTWSRDHIFKKPAHEKP